MIIFLFTMPHWFKIDAHEGKQNVLHVFFELFNVGVRCENCV